MAKGPRFQPKKPAPISFERRGEWGFGALVYGIYVDLGMAAVFLAVMSFLWSLQFALILMPLMIFHEFGHAWGMRLYGIRVKGIYFLPPIGLAVVPEDSMDDRLVETDTALLGPAWGLVSALVGVGLWMATGQPLFAQIAVIAAYLNLFNLLPVNPLDGGRVVKSIAWSIHPKAGIVIQGLGLLAALYLMTFSVLLGVFVLYFGVMEFRSEYRALMAADRRRTVLKDFGGGRRGRPPLTVSQLCTRAAAYIAMIVALSGIVAYFY